MRRYGLLFPLFTALLLPGRAQGQIFDAPGTAERIKWGTVNVLLASDTSRGLEVWAATSIFWNGTHNEFSAQLDPEKVTDWLDRANLIVTTKSQPANAAAVLVDSISTISGGVLAIVRKSEGNRWSKRVLLVLRGYDATAPWAVDASLPDMTDFIRAAFRLSSVSTYRPPPASGDTLNLSGANATPPQRRSCPGLAYPREMGLNRQEGEVWTQYVVAADGAVEPETIRILLSDDSSFTRSAVSTISACKFNAGVIDGRPVRVLVSQHVIFKLRR